ncbi:MAG: universal stress protein [Cyanobacteria bacterium SZAS-4]|nr:universal stress protein [Cyanobacteria bacterium SZAS-4]
MKIVVAIDGSTSSEAAVDALTNLQLEPGTEIKLITATEPFNQSAGYKAAEKLEGIAHELHEKFGDCKISLEIAQGDAKACITDIAKEWYANLIIMGSRNQSGLKRMLMGSVSQGVLTQSQCPVVIAKAGEDYAPRNGFKRIMMTVDNSEYSKAALGWLHEFQWGVDTQFKIVTAVPKLVDSFDSVESITYATNVTRHHDELIDSARAELIKLCSDLAARYSLNNISSEVGEGDPKDVIVSIATNWSADLIVMGSHGRTGFNKLLLGSVSQAVALQAPCSVAIVRGIVGKSRARQKQTGLFSVPNIKG